MRAVLLLAILLILGGAAVFVALGGFDQGGCPDDALDGGTAATRADCAPTAPDHAEPAIREEVPPAPLAAFDPEEVRRLRERGLTPVHARDVRLRVQPSGRGRGPDLVAAVSAQVPVRFLRERDRKLLEEVEVPPHFEDHEVSLMEVLDVWRSAGLHVDPASPVLIIGSHGS